MPAPDRNHGSPKYLVAMPASAAQLARLARKLADEAARGPVACPACDGENGTPPRDTCRTCNHRWHTAVVVLD